MVRRSGFALGAAAGAAFGFAVAHLAITPATAATPLPPPAAQSAAPKPPSAGAPPAAQPGADAAGTREFKVVGTDYRGTKRWEPATLICYEGEKIKLTLINKITGDPNVHGFTIAAFGVKEEIANNSEKTIEFVADKAGLHTINCHLHPKHIGGQILVLTK